MMRTNERYEPPAYAVDAIQSAATELSPSISKVATWYDHYVKKQSTRIAHDLHWVETVVKPQGLIVDAGAAPYLLTLALKQKGYDVEGLDVEPDRFAEPIKQTGLTVRRCDIDNDAFPYADETVDVVLLNEVFEHLRINPVGTMREIFRVLRPGGRLMLSTPNGLSLNRLAILLTKGTPGPNIYKEYSKLTDIGHMGHVREYAPREVEDLIEKIGFKTSHRIRRGSYYHLRPGLTGRIADGICMALPPLRQHFALIAVK